MIKGERITLRAIERDDLSRYVTWLNDTEITRHLAAHLHFSSEDEKDWYEAQRKDSSTQNFAIVLNDGLAHIGGIGLMHLDHRQQHAELGIFIGEKSKWGQGYGREAIGLLLGYGFNELNLHRIYLRVDASNTQGIRCYTHCGFVEEGRLRDNTYHGGQFEDQLIMSVLRPEYQRG
jgi:RimJ/RimL family protein N-acetyltransferase